MMHLRDVHAGDAAALAHLITEFTGLATNPAQIRQRLARKAKRALVIRRGPAGLFH